MQNLWGTAERLRVVQAATRRFVTLWAIDQAAQMLDRQWAAASHRGSIDDADLTFGAGPEGGGRGHGDWSSLYRGNILDD